MRAFRIAKAAHLDQVLSGIGAALYPGRWNSRGVAVVYTATGASLAMLEMLAHLPRTTVPSSYLLVEFELPDDSVRPLDPVPRRFDALPVRGATRAAGDRWIASAGSLGLLVPSAVVPSEHNLLINPAHPRIGEIARIGSAPLRWDERLFRK